MARQILETNNYSKFILAPFNREIGDTRRLEALMLRDGFWDEEPILVKRVGNKLMILKGQHRFFVARKLGIPVKYVETQREVNIPEGEKAKRYWSMEDHLFSYCQEERPAYLQVKEYHEETGIPLNACVSMLGGNSAGSGNHSKFFKAGTYKLGDPAHAAIVGDIILHLKKIGISWATNQYLVIAISKIAWAEGFNPSILKTKMSNHRQLLEKQASKQDYVDMLDTIYNRNSQVKVPLAFLADEAAKKRNITLNR